jgi:hypothetical protein
MFVVFALLCVVSVERAFLFASVSVESGQRGQGRGGVGLCLFARDS